MEHNAVVWFEIYVQDMDRAKKFYETVLDVKLEKLPTPMPELEMWAFPYKDGAPGASGALAKMEGAPSGGGTLVYFASKDCAIEEARIVSAGGQVFRSKFSIGPYGFITIAQDTEGNMVGLHSME